ncbi:MULTISPECIES: WecB/TagA/CpsF family glycosyltransferase [unclassified Janthinobacterium]|uniref:WecB/TagA/CpsF family glycosyltransferase n=1 Tax=unclassified Janthinobacterium TaxID=2610881 RepID=UPI0016191B94|nr:MULTISPECIES: WecB/TagA/CpsF family glycosyltransferase [unclassified Janthinobacterium]MBB5369728.1 beta-1,4-glucosyltransferase [Janthinobacterium sp. K2C7]MBB5382316.1 beta-1,4-glucosyltransferase [Janthinobacterium sp. K2Li3]MBB5387893.1 beta-1,4-glucosyltransferase [Janthinobacterium sp. K2E3]
MDAPEIIRISQFPVLSTTREWLAQHLLGIIARGEKQALFFANTNFIVKNRFVLAPELVRRCVIVNDGIGMDIAAKLIQGRRFASNLNGTDFTPFLFQQSPQPLRVFMLGAQADVLAKAVRYVREVLGQEVVGSCDGHAGIRNAHDLVQQINATRAQVVLVAMGNPIQERWILEHQDALSANVLVGVGALFDFWSGGKRRAPAFVQRIHMEWFYRLLQEPRRLLRRYTWDILVFLRACFKYR